MKSLSIPSVPMTFLLSAIIAGTTCLSLHAQQAAPRTTPVLFHGFADLSAVLQSQEDGRNSGRVGIVITHFRSGWGIGYARQRSSWRGEGPSIHMIGGWFGNGTIEPQNAMNVRSMMVIKEFHLANTEYFRPCLEAGLSFIEFQRDELVVTGSYPQYSSSTYVPTVSHVHGLDLRIRAFFPISRVFAFETAFHSNINEVRSYTSFELGIAFGMVRPPKPKGR